MRNDLIDACLFASLFKTLDIFRIDRFSRPSAWVAREKANVLAPMLCAVFAIAS